MSKKEETTKDDVRTRARIAQIAVEVLEDPDFGKELSEDAKKRLRSARNEKDTITLDEVKKKYL